ncbi:MAG: DUF2726 domain-containing protein [Pseudomonadota bacterium]
MEFITNGIESYGVFIAAGVLLLGITFFWYRNKRNVDFAVQRRSRILSPAEKNFFECLVNALSDDYYIFTKVAMLDVVEMSPTAKFWESRRAKKRLSSECLDYVLCKKQDLSIFGVVELENFDKKSNQNEKVARERLINSVCKAAHLRLFYFDVRQDYQGVDIRRLVTGRSSNPILNSPGGASKSQFTIDNSSYAAFAKQRTCPQCNGEVVTKVAVKGKRIGEKFLMCRKYPYCDYRVAMNDKTVIQKIQQKDAREEEVAQRPGFRDWSAG